MATIGVQMLIVVLLVSWNGVGSKRTSEPVQLNEENWSSVLDGEWMVEFYAPWCPACRSLQPEWESFASWSEDLSITVAGVDVTTNPGLSGRFMITALPTIYHVKNGVFRQYGGVRNSNAFIAFIEEKKWEEIEPVSSWKSPDSMQMSIVSYFFKISMDLRSIHNQLVEEYGVPYWASYIMFGVATILLGALLGLLIVFVIDTIFPAPKPPVHQAPTSGTDEGDIQDEAVKKDEDKNEDLRKRNVKSSPKEAEDQTD